jgi:hypothetical protein
MFSSLFSDGKSLPEKSDGKSLPEKQGSSQAVVVTPQSPEAASLVQSRHVAMHMSKGIRSHFAKGKGGASKVIRLDLVTATSFTANGSGVFQLLVGASQLVASTDFTAMTSLFDIVRVKAIHIEYRPIGGSQPPSTGAINTHGPMIMCADPDAQAALAYTTLIGSRPLSDKKVNRLRYTGKDVTETWNLFGGKKVLAGTTTPVTTLSQWNNVGLVSTAAGGILVAAITNNTNVVAAYGYAQVNYVTEWSVRL